MKKPISLFLITERDILMPEFAGECTNNYTNGKGKVGWGEEEAEQ